MTTQEKLTALKRELQDDFEAETDAVKRREIAGAINGLFDLI